MGPDKITKRRIAEIEEYFSKASISATRDLVAVYNGTFDDMDPEGLEEIVEDMDGDWDLADEMMQEYLSLTGGFDIPPTFEEYFVHASTAYAKLNGLIGE